MATPLRIRSRCSLSTSRLIAESYIRLNDDRCDGDLEGGCGLDVSGASKCIAGSVATNTTGGYGKHGRGLKRGMRRAAGKIENYLLDLYRTWWIQCSRVMLSCCRSRKTGDYSAEPRSEALYA